MGVVYRAAHEQTSRLVALKTVRVPRAALLQTIRREIHALTRLRHPGIVRVLAEGLQDGLPWYAMELLEGRTLRGVARELAAGAGPEERPGVAGTEAESACWTRALEPETPGQAALTAVLDPMPGSEAGAGLRDPEPAAARPVARVRRPAAGGALLPALTLLRRLCAPLAFLHGEGLVHRDLKPDNVLVVGRRQEAEGRRQKARGKRRAQEAAPPPASCLLPDASAWPVLVDFGLASEFSGQEMSRDQLQASSATGGTVAYMAPEQARGDLVDARADLYALGCMLYELLTGRPPFVGASPWQVLYQHFEVRPAPPSELVDGVPAELDELVLRLLAKEPRQRLGHADAVAAALEALGAEDGLARAGPRARAYLYRPGFAGREPAFGQLEARLEALQKRSGGLVLVGGESGVGKTRLVLELAHLARQRRVEVLGGECLPGVGSAAQEPVPTVSSVSDPALAGPRPADPGKQVHPLPSPVSRLPSPTESARAPRGRSDRSPWFAAAGVPLEALRKPLQGIADRCREGGAEETERLLGPRGKLLAQYEPALRGLPGQEAHAEVVELPAEAARQRLFLYLAETFDALCEPKPLLLVLDDLQWADELTLGFLEYWLQTRIQGVMQGQPLLIVGTYRTEEVGTHREAPLQRLLEAPGNVCLPLGRLDEAAVGSMVSDMLALVPPPLPFVRYLSRQSEGNPFFVAEHLRTAVAEGLLAREAAGRWQLAVGLQQAAPAAEAEREWTAKLEALPLPRSIHLLVNRRLEGLTPESRLVAEYLAVLGRETEEELLSAVAPLKDLDLLEATRELLARQVIQEAPGQRLRFVHDKIREVAYERIDEVRRLALHRAAAEGIERRYGGELDVHLAVLGQHWEQAGQTQRARECYLGAARNAVKSYAHAEAERLYRAYLRLVEEPTAQSIAARNELGENVLKFQGRKHEALEEYRKSLEEAIRTGDRESEGISLRCMASVHRQQGRVEEALRLFEQAMELYRQAGDRQSEGVVLGNLGNMYYEQGRLEEARELYERALEIHRRFGNRQYEGIMLGNLGNLYLTQGRLEDARESCERALEIHRQRGDRRLESIVLGYLALLRCVQGRLEEARELCEQALEIHRRIGDRAYEGHVLAYLAELHHQQGRLEEARELYGQALAIHRQIGNPSYEGRVLGHLGNLQQEQGRLEEAQALYGQALGLVRQFGGRHIEGSLLGHLSELERRTTGHSGKAGALAEQAERLLEAVGLKLELGKLLCQRGHIALCGGQDARELLERARALADEVGAGPDSELGKMLARLQRAQEAFEAGRPLFRGECFEDIPEGLRNRLSESASG
jgi:predicted ATPase/serine/threonine protein kinase